MLTYRSDTILGDLPDGWTKVVLRDVLALDIPGDWGDDSGPHVVKVLRSTNLTNEGPLDLANVAIRAIPPQKARMLEPRQGDVLLERSGGGPDQPVGRVGFVRTDMPGFAFSNFLHLLRPEPSKIDYRYLGWVLHYINRTGKILRLEQQTTQMRNLNFRDYLTLILPSPPREEQAAIARILDGVDTAIDRARIASEKARQVRDGIVQLAFDGIGHDAFRGSAKCLGSPCDTGRNEWTYHALKDVADVERGKFTPRPRNDPRFYNGSYPFIQTGDVTASQGRVIRTYTQTLNDLGTTVSRQFPIGTIAITIAANIGETAILGIPMYFPDSVVGITVNPPHVVRCVELALRRLKRRLQAEAPQSAQKNINLSVLRPLRIALPDPTEQARIAQLYDAADALVVDYEESLLRLDRLRRGLMHDLLTGQVRVDAAATSEAGGNSGITGNTLSPGVALRAKNPNGGRAPAGADRQ